jgi:hypothetical protein
MTGKATKRDLQGWLLEALKGLGGKGTIPEICRHVWETHEADLRSSGTLFYTWQYDIRWCATQLRRQTTLRPASSSPRGTWEIASSPSTRR